MSKTLKHLRRVAKSAEHTLGRKMSTFEEVVEIVGSPALQQCQHNHLEAYKRLGLPVSDDLEGCQKQSVCSKMAFRPTLGELQIQDCH
eukprot:jgi/Picre1/33930/NNA_001408.t1